MGNRSAGIGGAQRDTEVLRCRHIAPLALALLSSTAHCVSISTSDGGASLTEGERQDTAASERAAGSQAEPGAPCERELEKACAQTGIDMLVCSSGEWLFNGTCAVNERCDVSAGAGVGRCQPLREAPADAGQGRAGLDARVADEGAPSADGEPPSADRSPDASTSVPSAPSNQPVAISNEICDTCVPEYPCVALGTGYTCRGQFADWSPVLTRMTFVPNGDGTITDTRNRRIWQQRVDDTSYSWDAAKTLCERRSEGGTGWRLPTKAELESIVDDSQPAILFDPIAFPNTPAGSYWTSSSFDQDVWYVSSVGYSAHVAPSEMLLVRCVR